MFDYTCAPGSSRKAAEPVEELRASGGAGLNCRPS